MDEEINNIIINHNTIQDPIISDKIELKIQKLYNISIPSIILENLSSENEEFELEDLKTFFNNFGEVLNIVITDKKSIVLFKTFFIANICREFLQSESNYKENMKKNFKVRWFDFQKDNELLLPNIKSIFNEIYNKNSINLKPASNDNKMVNNQGNTNNNIGIKMNMNMNINNFNINTTMNPMAQNQNINQLPYYQLLKLAQMNNQMNQMNQMKMNKNMPINNNFPQGVMPNYNIPLNPMQIQQQQNLMNMLMKQQQQNLNNMRNQNNINNMEEMNNNMNYMNNNMNLINNNMNNPQLNQNINQKMINQNANNNNNSNNDEKNLGKYTCKYEILIANDKDFQIARRLIGSKGCNMKKIINKCKSSGDGEGIKLRLRGKGSGYREGPENKESDEPLHLCISSKNPEEMKKACLLVDDLLKVIHEDYKEYCEKNNVPPLNTQIATRIENKNFNYKSK